MAGPDGIVHASSAPARPSRGDRGGVYLRRELRRRMRQSVLIALGLAVGIGLVITVTAHRAGRPAMPAS
jgi:hypothetical protein